MYQEMIAYLRNKKILILGFGREGRSSYQLLRRCLGDQPLAIADKKPVAIDDAAVTTICGERYLDCINDYDVVLKSPGIPFVGIDVKEGTEITCQTDLFLRFVPCESVGVTGTKGKTTTSTLIYEILRAAGRPCCLIGNVGVPVFDCIDEIEGKTAVIELSSHQLEFMRVSPHVAVLTNLYEEHLDHYDGFLGYINAKFNIVRHQTEQDVFITTADQDIGAYLDFGDVKSKVIRVSADDGERDAFFKSLCGINDRLIGRHNRQNCFFAACAARALGVDDAAIRKGIEQFPGIEHRMEPVGTFDGIKFYNDCIATMPHAVMCAVEALGDVDTLIFGGLDRGIDYSGFIVDLEKSGIKNLIGLPDTGHRICAAMRADGSKKTLIAAQDMEDAVRQAFKLTDKGKSCLLSPAAASYNKYKDFEEKGRHYKALVQAFAGE